MSGGQKRMTYTEAVEMARKGETTGFDFLYNSTKSNKYYLALKYVRNEETAKDVLQEAYIRAWKIWTGSRSRKI